jgi:hypothetical protein
MLTATRLFIVSALVPSSPIGEPYMGPGLNILPSLDQEFVQLTPSYELGRNVVAKIKRG